MKKKPFAWCENCESCIPLGEGDFFCDVEADIVICDYEPTDDYLSCGGKSYTPN